MSLEICEDQSRQVARLPHPPLNDQDAAIYLGVAVQTLRNWRYVGKGPAYYKLTPGPRGRVIYEVADLEAYKGRCRIDPEAA